MAITRIKNNQITDSSTGNVYLGINAAVKLQDYSITAGKIANSLVYGSDLTVSGNLTVNGTTTTIDTVSVVIEDPILLLAANQSGAPSLDIGFIGERGSSQNIAFVWDESQGEFVTVFTNDTTTNTTVTIASYASFHTFNADVDGNLTVGANATVTGNVQAGNIISDGAVIGNVEISGDLEVGNISSSGFMNATGNIRGGNLLSNASISAATTISATGNITGGNLISNAAVIASGLISSGSTIDATGNITGGNLTSNAAISAATTISATGNITGGNLTSNAAISAATTVSATGNITGGNIISNALITGATLVTSGNATIGGNLVVQGNLTYINIDDLRIEDPIIIMGTGANGAPLTTDDGMDRGIYMEYYKAATGKGNASVFWDNSTGNVVAAANVNFSGNNIVNVVEFGTFQAGNIWSQTINTPIANITTINATGNITGGNLITAGNVNGGQLYITGNGTVVGTFTSTSNIVANVSGIFYGDSVTGNGAIFGGIPGFTPLASNVVIQFAGNVNSYSQINFENVNGGNAASTDYVATANNGDDETFFINMGINSNTHTGVHDQFFADTSQPNDGYLYVVGSDSTGPGSGTAGNLIVGSTNGNVKIFVGNTAEANVRAVASTQGVDITNGNLYVASITSRTGRVTVNSDSSDTDFAVNSDTTANIFYVDAGTATASFGNSTQVTNALVSFQSSNSILIPRGNSAQRPAVGVTGMIRFNTTLDNLEFYDTDSWVSAGTVFTVIDSEVFNGDGSTVAYTLGSTQTTDSCIVSINGVLQIPVLAYSVTGNVLTFTEAPLVSDTIEVREITTTTTVKGISNSNGNAAVEVVDTDNDVRITGDLIPTANLSYDLGSPALQWNDLYLGGNSIYIGNVILKASGGNLNVRNFDDTADAGITGTFYTTSTTSGNLQIGFNHIEAINTNGNIELRPNGTGLVVVGTSNVTKLQVGNIQIADAGSNTVVFYRADGTTPATISNQNIDSTQIASGTSSMAVIASGGNIRANVGGATIATFWSGGIDNGQANGVGNIGTSSSYFNTIFAKATSAQYADLAEMYRADADLEPGTVVCFGGTAEVTGCTEEACKRVAGVVSTNPSYIMNSALEGDHIVAVALTGRVPTKVTGPVRKGDMMVSTADGRARAEPDPRVGTVIGKALEDFDGTEGVIEVVVGRL